MQKSVPLKEQYIVIAQVPNFDFLIQKIRGV